jgi:hypothetical protein
MRASRPSLANSLAAKEALMVNQLKSAVSVFAVVCASACGANTEAPSNERNVEVGIDVDGLSTNAAAPRRFAVIPGKARVSGRSITGWTEAWWHWLSEVPAERNPELDPDADCAVDQRDPVFFLPPLQASSFHRRCRVRLGKPVLIGVQAVLNSYPCPDPSFEPAPGQTLEEFLREGAVAYNNLYSNIAATIDGHAVELGGHRHTTDLFSNVVHPSLVSRIPDPCLTGTPQPAVGDGWYVVVVLAPGQHQIRITALNPGGQPVERIYDIETVR